MPALAPIASRPDARPDVRPGSPCFSSGPCAKRPGWSPAALDLEWLGRSHRAEGPKQALAEVIDRSSALLGMPPGWRVAVVPGSDTGAVEMAMWSLLGPRGVDVLVFESFSQAWAVDAAEQLRLDTRVLGAAYGALPDLSAVDPARDVVLAWNGTTSGVRIPHDRWIAPDREGLVIVDATSAAFAMALPWDLIDVATWSWQKGLGGEAAHGMMALSPRAVARLLDHEPAWPMPKLFRMTGDEGLAEGLFRGETINTPSMLCVADALDALRWAEGIGGLDALIARSQANLAAVSRWVAGSRWASFLAADPASRSSTSICLTIRAPWFLALDAPRQRQAARRIAAVLAGEGVAFDVAAHRDAPPGLRLWGGATVETSDLEALLPWLDWAQARVAAECADG